VAQVEPLLFNHLRYLVAVAGTHMADGPKEPFADGGECVVAGSTGNSLGDGSSGEYELPESVHFREWVSLVGLKGRKLSEYLDHVSGDLRVL
jgi:hypothetical protein